MSPELPSIAETMALCRAFVHANIDGSIKGIVAARIRQIISIMIALEERGYPADETTLLALSTLPYWFQEANYDDIDWCERDRSKMYGLADLMVIDFLVQMGGRHREDASAEEMETYRARSLRAIDWRLSRPQ